MAAGNAPSTPLPCGPGPLRRRLTVRLRLRDTACRAYAAVQWQEPVRTLGGMARHAGRSDRGMADPRLRPPGGDPARCPHAHARRVPGLDVAGATARRSRMVGACPAGRLAAEPPRNGGRL